MKLEGLRGRGVVGVSAPDGQTLDTELGSTVPTSAMSHTRRLIVRYRWHLVVLGLTVLVAAVTLVPYLDRPMVLDEVEFIEAARGIQAYGVPVYYHGYATSAGWTLIGRYNVHGIGLSTIYTTPDGFITAIQHGTMFNVIANWHPELYLYILALFLHLPVAPEVAARLLNLLCLEASALLIFGIARELLARLGASARWRLIGPLVAAALYELHPLATRGSELIDFTASLSVTTVLLFWFVRLRYNETKRGLAAQIVAFALVPWTNLGPFPAIEAAMGLMLLLALVLRHWRTTLRSLIVLIGGTALFYLTFDLYSLWSGIPASLTLSHSGTRITQALELVPYPLNWRHLGAQHGSFALWGLTAAVPLIVAAALYVTGRFQLLPYARRVRMLIGLGALGASLVVSVGLAALYGKWQGIGARAGVVTEYSSWIALLRFFRTGWASVVHLEWLVPAMALCVVLLVLTASGVIADSTAAAPSPQAQQGATSAGSAAVATARASVRHLHYVLAEMAIFCLVMAADLLFLAAQAWGFPKYQVPILAVASPLCAAFAYVITRRVHESRLAASLSLLAGALFLALLIFRSGSLPFTYRLGGLAAVAVLLAGALACAGSDLQTALTFASARVIPTSSSRPRSRLLLLYTPVLVLLLATPLAFTTIAEAVQLPGERGSLTYLEGTSWGVRAAGLYLRAHVQPGDQVIVRKDIAYYAGTPYSDDFPWTVPLHASGPLVIWAARTSSPGPGFVEVWRGTEFNVYKYTPQGGSSS